VFGDFLLKLLKMWIKHQNYYKKLLY